MNIPKYVEELAAIMQKCLNKIKEGDWKEVAYLDAYSQGMQAANRALGSLTIDEKTKIEKDMREYQEQYWAKRFEKENVKHSDYVLEEVSDYIKNNPNPPKISLTYEDEIGKWEVGFRNIVTILIGSDQKFEIKDIVEKIRIMKRIEDSINNWNKDVIPREPSDNHQ